MQRKARDLQVGDVFRMHVHGEVLAVASVASGKRIKVRLPSRTKDGVTTAAAQRAMTVSELPLSLPTLATCWSSSAFLAARSILLSGGVMTATTRRM
jgi:hypothetical protein